MKVPGDAATSKGASGELGFQPCRAGGIGDRGPLRRISELVAPASPDLRIIMRLWAVSKKALMIQPEDLERGRVQGGGDRGCEARGRRKGNKEEGGGARGRVTRGEPASVLETTGATAEPDLDGRTGQRPRWADGAAT